MTNRFRIARGKQLAAFIDGISIQLGRPIDLLDVGGRLEYWKHVPTKNIRKLTVLNSVDENKVSIPDSRALLGGSEVEFFLGDARNLAAYSDQSVDLVHSNSVIEHVGAWWDMQAMASEVHRVGSHGWIQTPAFEFPIEPHYRLPFVHWFGLPIRRKLLYFSPKYRHMNVADRRVNVDRINLLSFPEFQNLFPWANIARERVLLTKSYIATW